MNRFQSSFNAQGEAAQTRRAAMLARIDAWRALEQRAADASAKASAAASKAIWQDIAQILKLVDGRPGASSQAGA